MSDLTRAEEQQAADMMLDAQIDEWYHECLHQPQNRPELDIEPPDPEPPKEDYWYDDSQEVVAFARWYWSGRPTVEEVIDFFEKPWKWTSEYEEGFLAQKVKLI